MKKMKKLYAIVALAAMLPGATALKAQCTGYAALPYTTGFEGIATGSLPACWSQVQTGTNNGNTFPSVYQYQPNTRNGNCYFEFEASSGSSNMEVVALPMMQNISSLRLDMWVSMSSSFMCALEVGVLEADSTFTSVESLSITTFSGTNNWKQNYHEYTVYFDNYTGSGERIAIRAVRIGTGQYTVFIDDLTVSEFNGCFAVENLHMMDADSSDITIAWVDTLNNGASYTVTYWKDGGDTVVDYSTDTFYTATNLDASSNYNFEVTPNCSSGDGLPASGSFRTTCGMLMIPFAEGFETAAALECWSKVACASSTGHSTSNPHSGSGCFRFYWNTTPPQYLITPPLGGTDNDGVLVSFWYKKYSNSYTENFKVGYSTTTAETSAFTWGSEVIPTTDYQEFTAVYPAGVKYIAIQYMQNNGYYLYIDDFSVSVDNGCNKPNDAYIDSVGPYDAYLRWTGGGTQAVSYNLYYSTQNSIATATAVTGISDTSYTLTGLLPQTTYYAWVRTDCGSDSSDTKAFGSFTTDMTCAPLTGVTMGDISYTAAVVNWNYNTSVGFASQEVIITLVDNTDTTVAPVTVSATGTSHTFTGLDAGHGYTATLRNVCDADSQVDTASANTISFMTTSCSEISGDGNTNQYLPTYTYYNYSYTQSIYTAEQMPNIDTIRGVAFNVASAGASGNVRTWNVYLGHTSTSSFSGSSSWLPVSGMTLVASNVSIDASTTGWKVVNFDTAFWYNGDSNLVIAIDDNTGSWKSSPQWASLSAANQGLYVYSDPTNYDPANPASGTVYNKIPAVRFVADCEVPTCFAPMVTIDNVDSASISVHWNVIGIENSWTVGIKAPGDANYTYTSAPVTDTFYTFNGLNSNTLYSIVVGSLCIDTLKTTVSVRTDCGMMALPFFEDWESIPANGAWPACWDSTMHHNTDPSVNWEYNHTPGGSYSMFLMAANDYNLVVSPAVPLAGDQIDINFWARQSSGNSSWLKVGVITNPHDTSTFIPLLEIPDHDGNFHEYEVNTVGLNPAATYHVAWLFYSTSTSYRGAIDDITIEQVNSCPRPTAAVIDSADGSSIYLHWTSTGASSYEVGYSTVNDVNDSSLQTIVVNDTFAVVTGLDPMMQYYLWVRSLCGGDNSNWRAGGSAATACDTTTCDVVIDMVDSYGDGWNGNAIYVYQAGIRIGEATIANGSTGIANISVCASAPVEFRFHVGSYPSEAGVTIYDGGGAQLYTQTGMGSVSEGSLLATVASPCPSCIPPHNITLTGATDNSLAVSWTAGNAETQWEVTCNGVTTLVSTPSAILTGLDAAHPYTVSVRAVCAVGDTSFAASASFMTELCASAVTVENFDTTMASTTSSYSPVGYSLYNYSYIQTIIPADRMNANGTEITAMAFKPATAAAGSHFTNMDVYMANISEDAFGSDFIHPDSVHSFVHVIATADFTYTTADWQLHSFDTSFVWDGQSNVLVAVNRGHGSWVSGSSFEAHVDTVDRTRYVYNDGSAYNINSVSGGSSSSYVGNLRLISCASGCAAPVVAPIQYDYHSATVIVTGSGLGFELAYGTNPSSLGNTLTSTTGQFLITGLMPATHYYIAVRQLCDSSMYSQWVERSFTTDSLPCLDPENLQVTGTGYSTVGLSWTSQGNATTFVVHVTGASDNIYDTVSGTSATVGGLHADVAYTAEVKAVCMPGVESGWSQPATFTTDACQPVGGISVGNITANSAVVSWTPAQNTTGYTVQWGPGNWTNINDAETYTTTNSSYTITGLEASTQYSLFVVNNCAQGVESTGNQRIPFTTAAGGEGIADVDGGSFTLSPNPASSSVTIGLNCFDGAVKVEVVDMNGKVMGQWTVTGGHLAIDLGGYAQGAYFVRVTGERQTAVRKLIVR